MPADIVAEAQRLGVQLVVTPEGKIRWRCRGAMPELLRKWIETGKKGLLVYLRGPDAWEPAEASRILTQLRADLSRIEREQHRGKFHPVLARVLADGVAVAEEFIKNHAEEIARGWDAMQLLRDCARRLIRTARLELWKGHVLPWERSKTCRL
jgi:hypothetical protein